MAGNSLRFLIDFGSTFTKLVIVDLDAEIIVGRYQVPTTIETDITIGLRQLLEEARRDRGIEPRERKSLLACSSAGGGLRMITVGLVPSLSTEAGVRAALGAGAKAIKGFSYNLNLSDIEEIERISPDIILLSGGTDGGDTKVIIANADKLSRISCRAPIVVAGNRDASDEIRAIFKGSKRNVVYAENVMPRIGELSVDPCREAIRQIFVSHIIKAKGIDKAINIVDETIIPTPSAVLRAAELLAEGLENEDGFGELMVVDVGGATTDVYSVARGYPTRSELISGSLPEPYAKRTVEGDLGVRHNIDTLIEMGEARGAFSRSEFRQLKSVFPAPASLPSNDLEFTLDSLLAGVAVNIAGERHCGRIKMVMGVTGELAVQEGKDLSDVSSVIGTGGPLVFSRNPGNILKKLLFNADSPQVLRPREAGLYIDGSYVLYAMGLLSRSDSGKALRIMKKVITRLQ
jgi:uncharacterized protein (TIGR01319 family)